MREKRKQLTADTVHDDEGSVGDTEGSCHFTGEVHVAGRVDEVDQTPCPVFLLRHILQIFLTQLIVQRDSTGGSRNRTVGERRERENKDICICAEVQMFIEKGGFL